MNLSAAEQSHRNKSMILILKLYDQDTFIIKLNDHFTHVPLAILTGHKKTLSADSQWKHVVQIMLHTQI